MQKANDKDDLKTKRQREVDRLRVLYDNRPDTDEGFDFQGVLLSDAIERCVEAFALIEPFNPENLKPACYKLTIGDEYAVGGETYPLSDEPGKNKIRIAPFEVAVIKTHETINMPRFLIGRWNIQVSRAYKGLIWVGGPQVDAGYVGHLFCPIYNLSDQDVFLSKGDPIAVIDFVATTKFHQGKSKAYDFPPDRVLFDEYEPNKLVSGLVSKAKERLDKVDEDLKTSVKKTDKQVSSIQQRVDNFVSLTIAILAILFAAISVTAVGKESPPWSYISLFLLSGFASFFAASAWLESKSEGRLFRRSIRVVIVIGLALAFLMHIFWVRDQGKQTKKLSNEIEGMREEILELKKAKSVPIGPTTKTAEPPKETAAPVNKKAPPIKARP